MAATAFAGPVYSWGMNAYLLPSLGGPVPDFNQDAGPNMSYGGTAIMDVRFLYPKDQVSGRTGVVPGFLGFSDYELTNSIPAQYGTATIAPLANVTSNTPMALVSTNGIAASANIPIVPIGPSQNYWQGGPPVVAPLVLDFGFAFGTGAAGSNAWTVANASDFPVGMPLVIAGAGPSGNNPLLTWVTSAVQGASTITTNDPCVTAVTAAPIGTGNLWLPREGIATLYPTAHAPWRAAGPGAFINPSETIARGVSVTGVAGSAGGAFAISGWDTYWQPMNETITVGAGATTAYGKKAFKAIKSATPLFTDAHNYSIGTSDVFGMHFYETDWESTTISWAGAAMTASQGFTAGLSTTTAPTATTADVRGTVQTSAIGGTGGGGIGTTASSGTISSLARSGYRLFVSNDLRFIAATTASPFNTVPWFGQVQF